MTATTTPRLGLLSPTSADEFDISDFVATMSILDNAPGIKPVANYASLPAGLTTAQHGSVFLQLDNGSLWMWNKPGAPAGSFKKINSVGMIQGVPQAAPVSTSTTSPSSAPSLINTTFTFPGGRTCIAFMSTSGAKNSGTFGYSVLELWVNGNLAESSLMSGGAPNKEISHRLFQPMNPGNYGGCTPGATTTIKVTARATSYGGGTTTVDAGGQLYIFEI